MTEISISEARADLASVIRRIKKKPITITNHGEAAAIMVSPSLFEELLEAMEDLEDILDYDKAKAESGRSIPWELVKKDLGLV